MTSILELKLTDLSTWEYLGKNSVSIKQVSLSSQLDLTMLWNKTIGRLKLLEELLALHRTSQLPEQVNFDVQQPKNFEKPDYQLIGRHLTRLISNTNKLLEVMDTFDKTFSTNIFLQNDMFKVDFPNAPAHEILQNDIIGSELSETFVNSRLHAISRFEHCSEKGI